MDRETLVGSANAGLGGRVRISTSIKQCFPGCVFSGASVSPAPKVSAAIAGVPRQCLVWPGLPSGAKGLLTSPSYEGSDGTSGAWQRRARPGARCWCRPSEPGRPLPSQPSCWCSLASLPKPLELFSRSNTTAGPPVWALYDHRHPFPDISGVSYEGLQCCLPLLCLPSFSQQISLLACSRFPRTYYVLGHSTDSHRTAPKTCAALSHENGLLMSSSLPLNEFCPQMPCDPSGKQTLEPTTAFPRTCLHPGSGATQECLLKKFTVTSFISVGTYNVLRMTLERLL